MFEKLAVTLRHLRQKHGILGGCERPELTAYAPLEAAPALSHPVLFVPALGSRAKSFTEMAEHFASQPANGPVGRLTSRASEPLALHGEGKVAATKLFALDYVEPKVGSTLKVDQVADAVERITALTGTKRLTFITHSAGAHDTRLFLQTLARRFPEHRFDVIAIGQGQHGLHLADVVKRFSEKNRAHYDEASRRTWHEQQGRTGSFTFIGVTGAPTYVGRAARKDPSRGAVNALGFCDGDGYTPAADLFAPGADTRLLRGADFTPNAHKNVVRYSGVIGEVQRILEREGA